MWSFTRGFAVPMRIHSCEHVNWIICSFLGPLFHCAPQVSAFAQSRQKRHKALDSHVNLVTTERRQYPRHKRWLRFAGQQLTPWTMSSQRSLTDCIETPVNAQGSTSPEMPEVHSGMYHLQPTLSPLSPWRVSLPSAWPFPLHLCGNFGAPANFAEEPLSVPSAYAFWRPPLPPISNFRPRTARAPSGTPFRRSGTSNDFHVHISTPTEQLSQFIYVLSRSCQSRPSSLRLCGTRVYHSQLC